MSQPPGQDGGPHDRPGADRGGPDEPVPPWSEQPTETFGQPPVPPYGQQPTQVFGQPGPYGGPPGPYGGPPGPYGGPPGPYGAPPGPYGGPPPGYYGAPPPYGPPGSPGGYGEPPKRNPLLPWLIVAAVVVLVGVGVGAYFLVRGNGTTPAASSRSAATTTTAPRSSDSSAAAGATTAARTSLGTDLSQIPGGAAPTGSLNPQGPGGPQAGQFPGSGDAATQWLQAMYDRDFDAAYQQSCTDVQDTADRVAAQSGDDPAQLLGASFYGEALDGKAIAEGQLTHVEYNPDANEDMATFQLTMADGSTSTVTIFVTGDLTVCDWS